MSVTLLLSLALLTSGCVQLRLLPTASFTLSPNSGPSPLIVTFDASTSHSSNGVVAQYTWNFGDGQTGLGMIVSHLYAPDTERTFTITLQITDQQGSVAATTNDIIVRAPSGSIEEPSVVFVWPFHYDAEGEDAANLNDEYFTLRNTGEKEISFSGWSVENDRGDTFMFPESVHLAPNTVVTVHSGSGVNSPTHLYLQASEPIWSNHSDLAFLLDAEGQIVDFYVIQSCS